MWKMELQGDVFLVTDNSKRFVTPDKSDAEWLVAVLDEATNTVVKLYCLNRQCRGYKGFITRAADDAKKNIYVCDDCGKAMVRYQAAADTSEKQGEKPAKVDGQASPLAPIAPRPGVVTRADIAKLQKSDSASDASNEVDLTAHVGRGVYNLEERVSRIEQSLAKLESDSTAQAESFQVMMGLLDELARRAKTTQD